MKIPPQSNVNLPQRPAPETPRPAPRRTNAQGPSAAAGAEDGEPPVHEGHAAGRDFARVLEKLTKLEQRQDDEREGDRRDAKQSERAEGEPEARRREERHGESDGRHGGGFEQPQAALREVSFSSDASAARAILHVADLERIVSAVRAQALAQGGREVVIELKRSVLEGLRVRLTTDAGGRVTAEFIAASERVRAQLDGRSAELAELLRSRGVNLATLRTTVGAEVGGGRGDARDDSPAPSSLPGRAHPFTSSAAAPDAEEPTHGDADEPHAGSTYRA